MREKLVFVVVVVVAGFVLMVANQPGLCKISLLGNHELDIKFCCSVNYGTQKTQ